MTDSKSEPRQWAKHAAEKLAAKEWLAVYISGMGVAICIALTIVSISLAGIALWVAYDANENAKILEIRIDKLRGNQSE